MDTKPIVLLALQAKAAREAAKRRHARNSQYAELKKFCSGGLVVFTGLLLAVIYSLLTHRIPM